MLTVRAGRAKRRLSNVFDFVTLVFWSAAYSCIVYCAIKWRAEPCALYMPLISGCLNIAWEINAVIQSQGFWGHLVWLALDAVILLFNLRYLRNMIYIALYALAIVFVASVLKVLFRQTGMDWMLLSSFLIDLIMAIEFLLRAKVISLHGKALIATLKMVGDIGACMANLSSATYVLWVGIAVFITNLIYLCFCMEEQSRYGHKQKRIK